MTMYHIAIIRRVKPGMEEPFETTLREFARESLHEPGTMGVHLIGPAPGGNPGEYGILRSFESEAASQAFYASERFRQYEERVAPFVEGPGTERKLHGLEAFFSDAWRAPPPRWKMALVTWLGVFPTVVLWSSLGSAALGGLHWIAITAIVNVFVVVTLAWFVMPLLTRLFRAWLQSHDRT